MTDDTRTAEQLREALADRLSEQGTVTTPAVDAAVRAVPRDVFVRQFKPDASLEESYADTPVYTKFDDAGVSISAVSQPTINGLMLELTDAREDMKVLEAGAGSGLFASYLSYLVGDQGNVVTIDVDQDLVDGARSAIAKAGVRNVTVVLGDGALGYPEGAPYDRIVATVGAHGIPLAWLDQLAPDGRLVAPMRLRGSVSRAVAFERDARAAGAASAAGCAPSCHCAPGLPTTRAASSRSPTTEPSSSRSTASRKQTRPCCGGCWRRPAPKRGPE
jgi:protein-L-isoaspartate(D-aspartate) O-methyltransferase